LLGPLLRPLRAVRSIGRALVDVSSVSHAHSGLDGGASGGAAVHRTIVPAPRD
jgi:hypothetical protein